MFGKLKDKYSTYTYFNHIDEANKYFQPNVIITETPIQTWS